MVNIRICLLVGILALGASEADCLEGFVMKKADIGLLAQSGMGSLPCIVKNLEAKTNSKLMLCIWSVFADSKVLMAGYNGSHCIGCKGRYMPNPPLSVADFNSPLYFKQGRDTFLPKFQILCYSCRFFTHR